MPQLFYLLLMTFLFSCAKLDNYPLPGETLTGELIDAVTGEPLQTQTYDCMIKLEEKSWSDNPEPFRFTTRPDGTFQNTKVFAGRYIVTPVDGPFIPIEGKEVDIHGTAEVSFTVEPFLNVEVTGVTQEGRSATVSFNISSRSNLYKVLNAEVFVNSTELVSDGGNLTEFRKSVNLESLPNEDVYTNTYSQTITGLISGRTYYIRVGARSDDPVSRRYNYSKVTKIVIP